MKRSWDDDGIFEFPFRFQVCLRCWFAVSSIECEKTSLVNLPSDSKKYTWHMCAVTTLKLPDVINQTIVFNDNLLKG